MPANAAVQPEKPGADVIRTGLFGREILASRSPWLHESEGRAQALDLSYDLFDFSARGWNDKDLRAHLTDVQNAGYAGVNITHPFKQDVVPLLDALAPSAESVGAVNTLRFLDGKMVGHNTDVTGFAKNMRHGLPDAGLNQVVQFGAGGGGSATALALLSLGTKKLVLIEPDQSRSSALASRLKLAYPAAEIECRSDLNAPIADADGVVNATPIGMAAHPGTPLDPDRLHSGMWVADIVYFPLETALLQEARVRGCQTLDGRGMAVFQAADAFEIFTGAAADVERMLASFDAFSLDKAA